MRVVVAALCVVWVGDAIAQERLETIAARGYVREWLVCGPFPAAGLSAALSSGGALLGDDDPFAASGGIAKLRPKHLQTVQLAGAEAVWQEFVAESPVLGFADVFEGMTEGVAFAAFRTEAGSPASLLLELETPLGARVYLNGFPVREIMTGPLSAVGHDRFLLTFRPGTNLVVMQLPVVSLDAITAAVGSSPREMLGTLAATRPMLPLESGFELALWVHSVRAVHGVAVVPSLASTGTFSQAGSAVRQDTVLTLFNPQTHASPAMRLRVTAARVDDEVQLELPPLAPGVGHDALVPVPIGDAAAGFPVNARLDFTAGGRTVDVDVRVTARDVPERGTVYVVPATAATDDVEARLETYRRAILLMGREEAFGFGLGPVDAWWPLWTAYPEHRESLLAWIALGRAGSVPAFAAVDERLATPEVLVRNLRYGAAASESVLDVRMRALIDVHSMGVTPQTAQLLKLAELDGIVVPSMHDGVPGVALLGALNGDVRPMRLQESLIAPRSAIHLRQLAAQRRRTMLGHGVKDDVLVLGHGEGQQSLWLSARGAFDHSIPRIAVTGSGAQQFFEATSLELLGREWRPRTVGRLLTTAEPGAVLSQRAIKEGFYVAEVTLNVAERFAAMAALLGAEYPSMPIDAAWRRLLYAASPDRLGFAGSDRARWDAMSANQDAGVLAREVLVGAAGYLARQANTLAAAPSDAQGTQAIVIFNPALGARTDVCTVDIALGSAEGLTVLDGAGEAVSYFPERLVMRGNRIASARVTFTAANVPSFGYATYFAVPSGGMPRTDEGEGGSIENAFFRVTVNSGGAIMQVYDKRREMELVEKQAWADVVALREDWDKTRGGRELWTTGAIELASAQAATVTAARTETMERLIVTSPFLGGTLTRRYTLYRGVPRIDVELEAAGVGLDGRLLAVSLGVDDPQLAPVFGERFGAVVGAASARRYDHRTDGGRNVSGSGAQPAYRWAAVSANDGVYHGDAYMPFAPVTIVHGSDPALRGAAEALQTALLRRGIPAETMLDAPDGVDEGDDRCRIVLGSLAINRFAARLTPQLSEEEIASLEIESDAAVVVFLLDAANVAEGLPGVPTLWVVSDAVHRVSASAEVIGEAIGRTGSYHVPPARVRALEDGAGRGGLAVLFGGMHLAALERAGPLLLMLAHGDGDVSGTWSFAVAPFAGTWRTGNVAQMAAAYAEKLVGVTTDLHLGSNPARMSFLATNLDNFVMTGVEPAADHPAAHRRSAAHSSSGFVMRGYESKGERLDARFDFFGELYRADEVNLLHREQKSLAVGANGFALTAGAFDVVNVLLQPSSRVRTGASDALWRRSGDSGPVVSRYSAHGLGGGNVVNDPISVTVRAAFEVDAISGHVVIANNLTDAPAVGVAAIETPAGWTASPSEVRYELAQGEYAIEEVIALRGPGIGTVGALAVSAEQDGVRFRDTASAVTVPFEVTVTREEDNWVVRVVNRDAIRLEGLVEIVGPVSAWGAVRREGIDIAPFREATYRFDPLSAAGAAIKAAANGYRIYLSRPSFEDEE